LTEREVLAPRTRIRQSPLYAAPPKGKTSPRFLAKATSMPSKPSKSEESSPSKQPRRFNRKAVLAIIIIAIPSIIVLAPALYYGSFTLHTARISFMETTTTTTMTASASPVLVETRSVLDYSYSIQTGGILRTNDSLTSNAQGTVSISIKITVTTPAAHIVVLGPITVQGGIGERAHTLYLGPGEGVKDSGLYDLAISITATIIPASGSLQTATASIPSSGYILFEIPSS
jgi:hypothetical protein